MQALLVTSRNTNKAKIFSSDGRDNCNNKFILLRKELTKRGIHLEVAENGKTINTDICIMIDIQPEQLGKLGPRALKILIVTESPIINSFNQDMKLRKKFDLILTWENDKINNRNIFWLGCGCSFPEGYRIDQWPSGESRDGICIIAGNKMSAAKGELYSERRKAIEYFEGSPENICLYGGGWHQRVFGGWKRPLNKLEIARKFSYKVPNSYMGECNSKFECMKKFKYSICYENAITDNGYITEKIFDSMLSGCVPIYLGASNITDFVDKKAFIQKNQFKDYEELDYYLRTMDKQKYSTFQSEIKKYTESFIKSTFYEINWAKQIAEHCSRLCRQEV